MRNPRGILTQDLITLLIPFICRRKIESLGRFYRNLNKKGEPMLEGNEIYLFSGASRACDTGDKDSTKPCDSDACKVCEAVRLGSAKGMWRPE